MSLLTWTATAIGAALAIPSLLLLYFLKLRRQEREISSTLLWKRAVHDLQVNSPFQKLRKNLLLFLQMLVLLGALFAIGTPVANFKRTPEKSIVILIDRSASMNSREADGRTRLEHAQAAALQFVKALPDASRAMVIAFADRAEVICTFTDDKRRLARQIEEIAPTDARSEIGEALQLAVAYSSQLVSERGMGTPEAANIGAADLELFSDGRLSDAVEQVVTRGQLHFHRVGTSVDNVGIVGFDVRRDYQKPGVLEVFLQVENFGDEPITSDVSLYLDGRLLRGTGAIQDVRLGPAAPPVPAAARTPPPQPSAQTVVYSLEHEAGGVIEARLARADALDVDNRVTAPIDPPRDVRILVVCESGTARAVFRRCLQESLQIRQVDYKTPAEYEGALEDDLALDGRCRYDLVILNAHDTNRLPPGNYLFFGGVPMIAGVSSEGTLDHRVIVNWQESHPLLRPAEFDNVLVSQWRRLALPPHALKLIEGEDFVAMAYLAEAGHNYLIAAFDLLDSNLPFSIPFLILMQNAVGYMTSAGLVESGRQVTPGHTITLPVPPGATTLSVTRPDGREDEVETGDGFSVSYGRTRSTGLYQFRFNDPGKSTEVYAANLLDANESHIRPRDVLSVGGERVEALSADVQINRPLWPYAVAAILAILVFEWWVYNRRVMI